MIIYLVCLAVGVLFTFISALAGHLFGGGDGGDVGTGGHAEAGFDHSGVPGLSFFSPTVLACFITAFGAAGLIFSRIEATKSVWISAPLAALTGMGIASLAFFFFNYMFHQTQSSSEPQVGTLVGTTGSILTPIPENGVGEIAYVHGGCRYTAPARTEKGNPIPAGKPIKITRIAGTQFFVEIA